MAQECQYLAVFAINMHHLVSDGLGDVVGLSLRLTAQRLSVPRAVGAMRAFLCEYPTKAKVEDADFSVPAAAHFILWWSYLETIYLYLGLL